MAQVYEKTGLPSTSHRGSTPSPGADDAAIRPELPLRRAFGDAHRHVAVEIGGREQQRGRRAVRQVGDCRRDDVAAPGIFDGHRDPQRHAQVPDLPRLRQPTHLRNLQVDHVHRLIARALHHHRDAIHHFVEDEWPVGVAPYCQALRVAGARLLDVDVHVADGVGHAQRLVLRPAGIGVGDQHIAALQFSRDGADAVDIGIGIPSHLELELGIAFRAVERHLLRHLGRTLLRNRAIQGERIAVAAAHQRRCRKAGSLAENVPTGHVQRRFHVGMAAHGGVHPRIQYAESRGIAADQLRRQLRNAGARAARIGGQIRRTQRTDFAISTDAGVGVNGHYGGIENLDRVAAGPLVAALMQREIHLEDFDAGDFGHAEKKGQG